jgi:hypothetical protein
MPVTTPEVLIVPVVVGVMLHVPPVVASVSGVVVPTQIVVLPRIAAGAALTVTDFVTVHPLPSE